MHLIAPEHALAATSIIPRWFLAAWGLSCALAAHSGLENAWADEFDLAAPLVQLRYEQLDDSWGEAVVTDDAEEAPQPSAPSDSAPSNPRSFFVEPRSVGTRRETVPPRYVRTLSETDWRCMQHADWLDFNADYRMRYEYRDDDFRRPEQVLDQPFLLRTRAYLGVHDKFDPLRGAIEFEDARRYNSQFPPDDRDVNKNEIIQAFGELCFADGVGPDRPLRFQYGRMAFEYIDRRLIARNEWRNTTNNFQGFRTILGQQQNDWQLDLLAVQPVQRLLSQLDRPFDDRWFYGLIGDWRRWSEVVTLQPYYLVLDQHENESQPERTIHTLALRGYGIVGESGWDYDFDVAFQVGDHDGQSHQAFGFTKELGYSWDRELKPRWSVFMGYASGDRDPNDDKNERFDRLFGFARPWSANDYFLWENLIAPKTRFEFQTTEKHRFDMGYGVFWLASDTDSWANANLRDPAGESGRFVGHELDIRWRWTFAPRVDVTLGYAHFIPGEFPRNLGKNQDSDFFYVEVTTRLLK